MNASSLLRSAWRRLRRGPVIEQQTYWDKEWFDSTGAFEWVLPPVLAPDDPVLNFPAGITVVLGRVGSGKTNLLRTFEQLIPGAELFRGRDAMPLRFDERVQHPLAQDGDGTLALSLLVSEGRTILIDEDFVDGPQTLAEMSRWATLSRDMNHRIVLVAQRMLDLPNAQRDLIGYLRQWAVAAVALGDGSAWTIPSARLVAVPLPPQPQDAPALDRFECLMWATNDPGIQFRRRVPVVPLSVQVDQ